MILRFAKATTRIGADLVMAARARTRQHAISISTTTAFAMHELLTSIRPAMVAVHFLLLQVAAATNNLTRHNAGRRLVRPCMAAIALIIALQALRVGTVYNQWDWMYLSGVIFSYAGLVMSASFPELAYTTVDTLRRQRIIRLSNADVEMFHEKIESRHHASEKAGQIIAVSLIVSSWIVSFSGFKAAAVHRSLWEVFFDTMLALSLGPRLGRLVGSAFFWVDIPARGRYVYLTPGHHDGVGGLRIVGQYYYALSKVASLPAFYLAGWLMLAPFIQRYRAWEASLMGLLAVSIGVEVMAFLLPMRTLHRAMREALSHLRKPVDGITREILRKRREALDPASDWQGAVARIKFLEEYLGHLNAIPSWPVSPSTRRSFSLNNLSLILPFAAYAVGHANLIGNISNLLRNWKS